VYANRNRNIMDENGIKIKAVLLNDTSIANHYGCRIVIDQIHKAADKVGIVVFHSIKMNEDWHASKHLGKIKSAQMVIVNGEGTMHDSREKVKKLSKVAEFCRAAGVEPFLINSVYQANDSDIGDSIKMFKKIYVRESRSQKELLKQGIISEVVPDMVFNMKDLDGISSPNRKKLIFTDSALNEITNQLYVLSKKTSGAEFMTLRFRYDALASAKRFIIRNVKHFAKSLLILNDSIKQKYQNQAYYETQRLKETENIRCTHKNEFFKQIVNAKLIVTGRFHMVCLAMLAKTPFIALQSNTHKIEGLLEDAGLYHRLFKIDNINNHSLDYYSKWNEGELKKINDFIDAARCKIEQMFLNIC
jgi:polysaccharide pyruvyl transferase WcaK-like protein